LYKISSEFPSEEKFPKGYRFAYGRDSDKEFNRFLGIAKGSCYEVQCQIYIARDLNYISHQKCDLIISKIDEILKMIYSLQKKLGARS
jgi:four helix bundle protein